MNISKKIARMAMGHDDYHIQHDPEIPCGEAEQLIKEETEAYIDKYIDNLEVFHKNTMSFIDSLDVYENDDRLEKVEELQALIKQGKQIQEFGLDGNIYTSN